MVDRSGLFVTPVPGTPPVGTSPNDGRRVLAAMFGTKFQALQGGTITQSSTSLNFTVAQSVWGIPDPTDATALFASPSDLIALTGTAGPGSGTRTDAIVVKQNDYGNSDVDSRVRFRYVTNGAVNTGAAPAILAGEQIVATVTVPANAATAAACTVNYTQATTLQAPDLSCPTLSQLQGTPGVLGQAAVVTSDSNSLNNGSYRYDVAAALWVKRGVIGQATVSSGDFGTGNTTGASMTLPVVSGHWYRLHAAVMGSQITTAGTPTISMYVGATQQTPRLISGQGQLAVGGIASVGESTALFQATSTGNITFSVQGSDSAGAFRASSTIDLECFG